MEFLGKVNSPYPTLVKMTSLRSLNHLNTRHIFIQVLEGAQFLHSKGILHHDTKGRSILWCVKNVLSLLTLGRQK